MKVIMPLPVKNGQKHDVFYLANCPSFHPLPNLLTQYSENEWTDYAQNGTTGLHGQNMNRST